MSPNAEPTDQCLNFMSIDWYRLVDVSISCLDSESTG